MAEEQTDLQKMLEQTKLNIQLDLMEEMLKHNELYFDYQGEKYRVKKPTFGQKKDTYKKRNLVLVDLMQKNEYMFERDLRKMLKDKRGIDIDGMDNRFQLLQQQKEEKQNALGQALTEKADEKTLNIYKNEIEKIENQQQLISFEKAQYLETSIERQVDTEIYLYLAYLLTERAIEESNKPLQWVRVWNTYDEFLNSYEPLIDLASYYATIISQNDIR